QAFTRARDVRAQGPLAHSAAAGPRPDGAVVRGELRDYLDAHPADPVLVVEVSLTSLEFDRVHKSSLYARAGRPEYWIVNLVDRVVEVRRAPAPAASAPYGWDYTTVELVSPGEDAPPLAAPGTQTTVLDLLP